MRKRPAAARLLVAALVLCSGVALAQDEEAELETPLPANPSGVLVYNFAQHPSAAMGEGPVRVSSETSTLAVTWGYSPVRVSIENSARVAHQVALEFVPTNGGGVIRKEVEVPAAGSLNVVLLVPAGANYGTLTAFSKGIKGGSARQSLYMQNAAAGQTVLALGTEAQFQEAVQGPPDLSSYNLLVRTMDPADAPSELAGYVGFNLVVVLDPIEQLPEAARRALEAYAATGGTLVLTRPPRSVTTYLPLLRSSAAELHEYGFGHVRLCAGVSAECALAISGDLLLGQHEVKPLAGSTSLAKRYVYDPYGGQAVPEAERFLLPQATAPVGRFLLIILAFTLAIGPGSVWVARKRGPPMLLLTIPATAAVTCLLIVGYSVLVDGFSVHASTRGYTLLDSRNKRAITVGLAAFYANVAPGDAEFDTSTAIVGPVAQYNSPQLVSVDWTRGASFGGDFVPSRTYREWGVLSVSPTRARLMARASGDGVVVENALGSEIRVAQVMLNGKIWVVRDLRDGGSRAAEETGVAPAFPEGVTEYRSRFGDRTANRTVLNLREGQFVAQVEGPALLPTGGLRLQQHTSELLVRGEVEQ